MHVVLAVDDTERAKAFYRTAFGWEPHLEWPGEYAELVLSDVDRLGLYQRDGFVESAGSSLADRPDEAQTGTVLYVRADDLDAIESRLRAAGARPLSERAVRGWGDEAAYYADPDGNIVAVARRLADATSNGSG